jgi:hypothetical protein
MATGDQADLFTRLRSIIPSSWFPADAPVASALINAAAWALSSIYAQITYATLQTRIKTATDSNLDLISQDFFGNTLPRFINELDGAFRARILANLFVKGPTRRAMSAVLGLVTGRVPDIFEPSNPTDSGGWDGGAFWDSSMGRWGDPLPYQSFVTAYRPTGGTASLAEWDTWRMSWDSYGAWSDIQPAQITDAAIIAAVESTRAIGTIVWMRIADNPVTP